MSKFSTNPMVFRMPAHMLDEVSYIAENNMISVSAVCRQAVSHYIKKMRAEAGADVSQNSAVNG
jgi:hypothetical protein|tara:strand:- start:385 stop:576 length:192 start_codon:yes stop_codon:yes gene_type:complete